MGQLDGQTGIVTGASSGFGRKIAIAIANEGATVACTDIREEPREDEYGEDPTTPTAEVIRENGDDAIFIECDVTEPEDVSDAIDTVVANHGDLDIMVNNAGVANPPPRPLHERPDEDLDAVLEVNTKGVWNGCKHAVTQFLEQGTGGNIINVVSTAGLYGWAYQSAYNASKGAAKQITETVAIEYGPEEIRANAICPGYAPTALTAELYENSDLRERIIDDTPLGDRWTSPDDVAKVAVFLASDNSEFMTGTFQVVDGGHSLRYAHTRGL